MSASKLFKEANSYFVEDEFLDASFLYNQAIELDSEKPNYYLYRAANYLKMEKYVEAIPDCTNCVRLDPTQHKAWQRKGMAYFNLDEYESSIYCFLKAKELGSKCDSWIRKCNAELKREEKMSGFEPPASNAEPIAPAKKKEKVRVSWCQSDKTVTVTLFVKKLKKENVTISCEEKELHVSLKLPNGVSWTKDWFLWGETDTTKFKKSVTPYKVEIVLSKATRGEDWDTLEDAEHHVPDVTEDGRIGNSVGKKTEAEWDELEQDMIEEEKLKPGDDWQKLFKHIYAKNDPATQRAMNKSWSESGGTVLSANWEDVGKKDYSKDVEGPEGTIAKKFSDIEN